MKNHRRNLFKRRMMRYTTRNEMVEIRSALYLKDKMTRRHKVIKTLTEAMYELCECFIYILDKLFDTTNLRYAPW